MQKKDGIRISLDSMSTFLLTSNNILSIKIDGIMFSFCDLSVLNQIMNKGFS